MKTLEEYIKDAIIYGYNLSVNSSLAQKDIINYNFDTITKLFISKTVDDIKLSQPSDVSDEIKDIIDCIIKYDKDDSDRNKASFFNVIQRDLKKAIGQIKPTIEGEIYPKTPSKENRNYFEQG